MMLAYGEGRYRTAVGQLVNPQIRREAQLTRSEWELRHCDGEALQPVPTDEDKALNPIC
jgi:hypothetical protein